MKKTIKEEIMAYRVAAHDEGRQLDEDTLQHLEVFLGPDFADDPTMWNLNSFFLCTARFAGSTPLNRGERLK